MAILKKRIARSLITIIFLTFFNVLAAPLIAPKISSPQAEATTSGIITDGLMLDVNASNATDMGATSGSYPALTNSGGGYYDLNGTSHYIVPNTGTNVGASNVVSIFMWVYPKGAGQLLSQLNSTTINSGYHTAIMEYTATDQIHVGLWSGSDQTSVNLSSTIATPKNNWYLVGLVYDGAKINGYINGVFAGSTSNFSYTAPATAYYGIGAYDATTIAVTAGYGNMRFGELSVYNTALTASDALANFNATTGRFGPTVSNPTNATNYINRYSTFTSSACTNTTSGSATCNYQWQLSTDGGTTWNFISGATSTSYTTPVLTSSYNGYRYRMYAWDPGTGSTTAQDIFTITSSATLSVSVPPGSDTDTALSLNGSSQYAEVADSTGSPLDLTGAITMEAWVKPADSCPGSGAVISKNVSYMMYCQSGKWMYMLLANGASGSGAATSISVDPNVWHHLAYTKSAASGNLLIYYDGALVQTIATGVTSMTPNNNVFRLGQYTGSYYFNGLIDEVHVYNTQRSQSQIATDMNNYGPLNDLELVAYYDFNEGSGSTLFNREIGATTATDLTISGSPSWDANQIAPMTTYGPYTVQSFNRTYLTASGGWKIPSNAKLVQYLVVAGGGAGGGSVMESHYAGGGGGAGGVRASITALSSGYLAPIVGQGQLSTGCVSSRGSNSSLTGGGITAINATGGGSGSCNASAVDGAGGIVGNSGGSGGGGGAQVPQLAAGSGNAGNYTPAEGFNGGASQPDSNSSFYQSGGGGGGAAVAGTNGTASRAGDGGAGRLSTILDGTTRYYGGGGGGGIRPGGPTLSAGGSGGGGGGGSTSATSGTANTGGGGGGCSYKICGSGGSGVIIIRWITATKPAYSAPVNANLNVGQTETFSTNVATDSATAILTRTFRWESTTTGSGGTFSLIKQGTGAANAAFAWIPTDTSTTGSNYLYRVIVTDSDTAGLFIQDTSTPVFATINKTLLLSSKSSLTKTIGVTKTETFTVTFGTPTYTYSLTPVNPNFWLDTSTVGLPRIKFADTVTVGTYYETFTVTDSVSASISVPLTITVSAPPSFSASSNMVDSGTVLYLDAGNSASYSGTGSSWNDLSGRGLVASLPPLSMPAQNSSTGLTCSTPTFSNTTTPNLVFNGTSTCGYVPNIGILPKYTYEVWFKRTGADSLMSDYSSMIASPFSGLGKQINITLHWRTNGNLVAGIWDGSNWIETTQVYVAANSWNYVAVTYDGLNLQLSLNGVTATKYSASSAITFTDALNDKGLLIGKRFDQNGYFFTGSIGSIRIYNRVLTDAEILQNYNATKDRFAGTLNENVIAKKYASRFVDTYTVTSGSESLTATFTNNALAGVKWDTSTARSVVLTLQDTLTPGTYYDTITATDIYGSSSRLPLTFTISKADTITVFIDTPTALNYTASKAAFTQTLKISGLVGLESGTAGSATVKFKPGGGTCATGGYCRVGDIGPGGGIVFIDTSTVSSDGRIYEVAPANWSGSDDLSTVATYCSNNNSNLGATQFGIGWGDTNTAIARTACLGGAVAKVNTFNQSNATGYSDWFIPAQNEAAELIKIPAQAGLVRVGSNYTIGTYGYWTSTEVSASDQRSIGGSGASWNVSSSVSKSESTRNMVRPVRAFKSCWAIDTCTAISTTDTPTAAGVYNIVPSALTIGTGSLNNYVAITYLPTNLTINKVAPASLTIPWINTSYPDTFTISIAIAAGTGNLTFTTTNGTASGCALDYRKIYTTTQGTCSLTVVRAADRNYLADTSTGTIFFLANNFAISQPTNQVGSGSGIGLNGVTSFETSTVQPPSITALSTLTLSLGAGGTFTITGTGFTGSISVKFSRNKVIVTTSSNGTSIDIPVLNISNIGATSGRIAVITAAGVAVSVDSLTITP